MTFLTQQAVRDRDWWLGRRVLEIAPGEWLTVRDLCESVQIWGAPGSGKSSGSAAALAVAMLWAGFGMLVIAAKNTDLADWRRFAALAGRAEDVVVFDASGAYRLNYLQYELQKLEAGGLLATPALVTLLIESISGLRSAGNGESERYWVDEMTAMVTAAVTLARHGSPENFSLPGLIRLIRSAPSSASEAADDAFLRSSDFGSLVRKAEARTRGTGDAADVEEAAIYFRQFAALSEKVRSIVITTFTSRASMLNLSPYRELFSTGVSEAVTPEAIHRGAIVVVNLPTAESDAAALAATIMKGVFQRATIRRTTFERPVCVFSDEAQLVAVPGDARSLQLARSSLCSTVYVSQNFENYTSIVGGRNAEAVVKSLFGCMNLHIYHANSGATNTYASGNFGDGTTRQRSSSIDIDADSITRGSSEARLPNVPSGAFTTLKKGGPENDGIVEAYVMQVGRRWESNGGKNWLLTRFKQT